MYFTDSSAPDDTDRPHIFVVNDTLEILDVLRELFEGERYAVTTAIFDADPLDQICTLQPAVLIVDLPPGGAGQDLLRRLDASPQARDIPVIVTATNSPDLDDILADATHRRIVGALLKPYDLSELIDLAARATT